MNKTNIENLPRIDYKAAEATFANATSFVEC